MSALIDFLLIFVLIASSLAFLVGLFSFLFKPPRKRGFKILGGSFVVIIVSVGIVGTIQNQRAIEEGFLDFDDKRLASEYGYTSVQRWNQDRHAVLAKRKLRPSEEAKPEQKTEPISSEKIKDANEGSRIVQRANAQSGQSNCTLKTCKMTGDVIEAFKAHHNLEAKPAIPNKPPCREDGFCDFTIDSFKIQIYGNGIADILTTTQASHSEYREICATAFSGLSGANINFAREAITAAFVQASQTGKFKQDINSVEIKVNPGINNILACEFFKYGR